MANLVELDVAIHVPSVVTLVGSTSSGKTTFVFELFKRKNEAFNKQINKILYCYSCYQPMFDKMKEYVDIEFFNGIPTKAQILDFGSENVSENNVIVLDDLMLKVMKSEDMLDLFCQYSHHLNLTVIIFDSKCFSRR